jgi:hypothetical protein
MYGGPSEAGWIEDWTWSCGWMLIRHSCGQNLHCGCGDSEDELANSTYLTWFSSFDCLGMSGSITGEGHFVLFHYLLCHISSRDDYRGVWLYKVGSNMTGTNCDLFTHDQSRSYLNHLVINVSCNRMMLFSSWALLSKLTWFTDLFRYTRSKTAVSFSCCLRNRDVYSCRSKSCYTWDIGGLYDWLHSFISNLSDDRSTASSKTIPPLNAI